MAAAVAVVLLACAAVSIAQARHWKDSVTLFEHAVRVTPDNFVAHYNLANALAAEGRTAEALAHYDRAKAIRPAPAHNTLGSLLAAEGRLDEAIVHYREAVRLDPRYADALQQPRRAAGSAGEGERRRGTSTSRPCVIGRGTPMRCYNLGRLDAAEGRLDQALARFGSALEANPELDGAYYTRANILAAAGPVPGGGGGLPIRAAPAARKRRRPQQPRAGARAAGPCRRGDGRVRRRAAPRAGPCPGPGQPGGARRRIAAARPAGATIRGCGRSPSRQRSSSRAFPPVPAERFGARVVERDEILQAMKQSRGYNLTATTNGPRFQSEVLLRLASDAEARDPRRQPLFIGHREWFEAYLERTGLTRDRAPLFVRLPDEYGQDTIVDYRPDRVVTGTPAVNAPLRALNVCIWWPEREGGPRSYSYEDTLSTPQLKVTNERVITYRLLDYGDMVVFNEITGLRGRPTTGILGMLFQLIGEGSVVESRIAVAADGLQITRARARKMFEVATTVTVHPDGRTEKDVPAGTARPRRDRRPAEAAAAAAPPADGVRGAVAPRTKGPGLVGRLDHDVPVVAAGVAAVVERSRHAARGVDLAVEVDAERGAPTSRRREPPAPRRSRTGTQLRRTGSSTMGADADPVRVRVICTAIDSSTVAKFRIQSRAAVAWVTVPVTVFGFERAEVRGADVRALPEERASMKSSQAVGGHGDRHLAGRERPVHRGRDRSRAGDREVDGPRRCPAGTAPLSP